MRKAISFAIGVLISFSALLFYYDRLTSNLPPPEERLPPSARILYKDGTPMYISRSVWMNLEDFPDEFIKLLLASEDRDFFKHHGIDVKGILRALFVNLTKGKIVQGGSTITQQLVRSLYLGFERSLERKIKEIFLALWMERMRSKEEILEMYLNSAYLGSGLYGFAAASLYYFGKQISELSKAEMAILIGIIKSPENYNPFKHPDAAKRKAKAVALAALDAGIVGKKEYEKLVKDIEKLSFRRPNVFFDEEVFWRVIKEAEEVTGLSLKELREGYEIVTTLDPEVQRIAKKYVGRDMAFLLLDSIGRIIGYRGKGVRVGRRQVGSAIKPIYYFYGLLRGIEPKDLLPDLPIDIAGWRPENFNRYFRGVSTVEDALVWSRNVPSVFLFTYLGYRNVIDFMRKTLKIKGRYPGDLTISLGTLETSPEEISKFYVSLINGGVVVQPSIVSEVRRISGGPIYTFVPKVLGKVEGERASEAILKIKGILREVVERGTGRKAKIERKNLFGKTGTAERNAWFIGGDGSYIMILVRDGKDLLGGEDVAPIWRKIAKEWGKIGKDFDYIAPKDGGKALLNEKNVEYIDYERLAGMIERGEIKLKIFEDFLSRLEPKVLDEFFERLSEYYGRADKLRIVVEEMRRWRR